MPLRYILLTTLALSWVAGASGLAAATCELPEKRLEGEYAAEMSAAFQGFVMGQVTGDAQQYCAEKLIDSYMRKADDAEGIMEGVVFRIRGGLVRASNHWVHALKAATLSKAVAAGEVDPIRDWARDEMVEASTTQFLRALGAAPSSMFVGALVASLDNVKESYDELEKQDCLKGIDSRTTVS